MRKASLAIVGAGRAGLGLARGLRRRGCAVTGVVARTRLAAVRAARLLGPRGGRVATIDLARGVAGAKVILICVPDAAIAWVAEALGALPPPGVRGKVVLHTSGAEGPAVLLPLKPRGASVGCFHPLVAFPPPGSPPIDLRGIAVALEGDPAAVRAGRALARALGCRPLNVPEPARAAYHVAASLLANGMVALLDAGLDLAARRLGITEDKARAAFLPLVRAAVENVARSGTCRALTGPVARGDVKTVARHMESLAGEDTALREIYRLLAARALLMAHAQGGLDPRSASELARILKHP